MTRLSSESQWPKIKTYRGKSNRFTENSTLMMTEASSSFSNFISLKNLTGFETEHSVPSFVVTKMAAGTSLSVYGKLLSQLNNVNLRNPVSMGLGNMEILDRLVGYPLRDIPVVHIVRNSLPCPNKHAS